MKSGEDYSRQESAAGERGRIARARRLIATSPFCACRTEGVEMGWLERGVREKWLVVGVRDASGRRYGRRQWKLKMRLERSRRQESWDESFLQDSRIFPSVENKAAFASLRPPRVASMNFHENHVRIFIPFLLQHPPLFFHRELLSGFGYPTDVYGHRRTSRPFPALVSNLFNILVPLY